jgi:hypothetical protein
MSVAPLLSTSKSRTVCRARYIPVNLFAAHLAGGLPRSDSRYLEKVVRSSMSCSSSVRSFDTQPTPMTFHEFAVRFTYQTNNGH